MQRKKILVFPFNLLSHYLRCLVLMQKQFNSDEYEIQFLSSDRYKEFILEEGYETFLCEQFDADKVMNCSEKFDFSWLNKTDIERVLTSQVDAIRHHQPDIVIGDFAPTLKMAAEITSTPLITLLNGYMTKHYAFTRKLSRTHKAYKYSKKLPENLFDKITKIAEKISFRIVHRPFSNLRSKYRLKKVSDFLSEFEGDQNLICDLPDLFPQQNLPANYSFIGQLIYNWKHEEGIWLEQINNNKPVICVCMGSTGNWEQLSFLNNNLFSDFTFITAGDTEKVLNAKHIINREFVNLENVLDKTDLLICHGGNGTIYSGLNKGIYMLCITSHFEQEWNVHALERRGFGRSVNDIGTDDWYKLIEDCLKEHDKKYAYL